MPGVPWTEEERKILRREAQRGPAAFARLRLPGRTAHAIRSQAMRMGLVERRFHRKRWSKHEKRRLKQLKVDGFSPSEVARFELLTDPPRSRWSITKQWGRLKLAERGRSRRMRQRKIWKVGERARFEDYLRKHSATQTPEQIGRILNVARSTVARWQARLGVKATRDEVLAMSYSQAKQRRARLRLRRRSLAMWERRRTTREALLVELAEQLAKSQPKPELRECVDCGRRWPKRRDFFPVHEKKISLGRSRYYKHRCVLCENNRRRTKDQSRRRRQRRATASNGQAAKRA